MCVDPFTISAVAGLAGTAISAAGAVAQGRQAQAMANYQNKAYERSAQSDAQAASYEMQRARQQQELQQSAALAQIGKSGVATSGSPTEVLTANARAGEMDLQAIQYGSQLRQGQLRTQGAISMYQGAQARQAANITAVGTLASGLSSAYKDYRYVKMAQTPSVYK